MTEFAAFVARFSGGKRRSLANEYGVDWERDGDIDKCRECAAQFSAFSLRRHHCRGCGGIYCQHCAKNVVTVSRGHFSRGCGGCTYLASTPGKTLKSIAKELLEESTSKRNPQAVPITLVQGKLFGGVVDEGYFELENKSSNFVCAKLFIDGNFEAEIARPSYFHVLPNDYVHCNFNPRGSRVTLLVLIGNPEPVPVDGSVEFIVKDGVRTYTSACAKVENFRDVLVYSIPSKHCNILLKYKPGIGVELRDAESLTHATKSYFLDVCTAITGTGAQTSIDRQTNAKSIELVYSSNLYLR